MKITNNERKVLNFLIDNGRMTDRDIAVEMDISPQAIGKIRKKLESNGIIENYTTNLSFEKLGIKSFALIYSDWIHNINPEIRRRIGIAIKGFPELMFHVQLSGDENDFFSLLGFRSQEEMERYMTQTKEVFREAVRIRRVSPFTIHNLMKFETKSLFKHALGEHPIAWNPNIDGPEFEKMLKESYYNYSDREPYKRVYEKLKEEKEEKSKDKADEEN